MSSPLPDPNELQAHLYLVRLHAGDLTGRLTARAEQSYLQASRVALAQPPGEDRQCLLRTLNSGVGSALRAHEMSLALDEARATLQATNPGRAEALQAHGMIGAMLTSLQRRLREAYAKERAAGRNPDSSAFFVFGHDMATAVEGIRAQSAKLLRIAPPAAEPDAASEGDDAQG